MKKLAALVLLLAGPFLVACQADEEVGAKPPSSPPLTKAELIKQGDRICRDGAKEFLATAAPVPRNPSRAQLRAYVEDVLVPEMESQLAALRALEPPRADLPRIDQMLDEWADAIEKVKEDPLGQVGRMATLTARGDRIATKYGFKVCNQS